MNNMPQPEDDNFKTLLTDYIEPVPDDGFSEVVLKSIGDQHTRLRQMKFMVLAAGSFIGGIIAATQMPAVWRLLGTLKIPTEPTELTAIGTVFAFIVWATIDNRYQDWI